MNATTKPFSWSYSNIDNFETCARKYYHQNIAKDFSDSTIYRMSGQETHDLMAAALTKGVPLPNGYKHWMRWIDELHDGKPLSIKAEQKLAFTEQGEPCYFFDKLKHPWARMVIDVLKHVDGYRAVMWDWKTGKMKPNREQLLVYAICAFIHYPKLQHIDAALVFLKEDTGNHIPRDRCIFEMTITKEDAKRFWKFYLPRVRNLQHAIDNDDWPPNPSGLCRRHCNVTSCEHNGNHQ